jgi:hypothetical protein
MTKHKADTTITPEDMKALESQDAAFLAAELEKQAAATPVYVGVPIADVEMPARFTTGGATADEKAAWIAEHGGQPALGEVAAGEAWPHPTGGALTSDV